MDTRILVKKLNEVFCKYNKRDKKYSEVWLSEVDMGGLYNNGMFVLCIKAEHEIDSCYDEINDIIQMLDKEAKEELEYIWTVRIYNKEEEVHCEMSDLKVFDDGSSC